MVTLSLTHSVPMDKCHTFDPTPDPLVRLSQGVRPDDKRISAMAMEKVGLNNSIILVILIKHSLICQIHTLKLHF